MLRAARSRWMIWDRHIRTSRHLISATYPLGDQVLHALGHPVGELGEVLGGERLAHLGPVLGEVEEG